MIKTDFVFRLNREEIYEKMNVAEAAPIREELEQEYFSVEQNLLEKAQPVAVWEIKEHAIYLMITLGEPVSRLITSLFESGKYLAGLLADTMSVQMLYQAEAQFYPALERVCRERHLSVKRRIEPQDEGLELLRLIFQETKAQERLGMELGETMMLTPEKSLGVMFSLDENCSGYHFAHSCRDCLKKDCDMREKEL